MGDVLALLTNGNVEHHSVAFVVSSSWLQSNCCVQNRGMFDSQRRCHLAFGMEEEHPLGRALQAYLFEVNAVFSFARTISRFASSA